MPQSPRVLDKVGEKFPQMDERYELEGTGTQSAPIRESGQHAVERTSSTGDLTLRTSTSVAVAVTTGAAIELESNPPPNFQHPQHRTIALHCTSSKVLPPLPPKALEGDETITLNRREVRSPSCSILCEEEEGIFPARKWTKPLANMGDALNWKFSVLHRFNAIQY